MFAVNKASEAIPSKKAVAFTLTFKPNPIAPGTLLSVASPSSISSGSVADDSVRGKLTISCLAPASAIMAAPTPAGSGASALPDTNRKVSMFILVSLSLSLCRSDCLSVH